MDYEAPAVDLIARARELVQNYAGPRYDGDGYQFSQNSFFSPVEEE